MVVHIDLVPNGDVQEARKSLHSMAKELTTDRSSIEQNVETEEGLIVTSFQIQPVTQGAAVSLIHKKLKQTLWEGWEDICISFSE